MPNANKSQSGRHFLQIPGPTNVPDRVLRAIDKPMMDHRSPDFGAMMLRILPRLQRVFDCSGPVAMFPGSGHGGWEAAMSNTLNLGDKVLAFDNGNFAVSWNNVARSLGVEVEMIPTDWRLPIDAALVTDRLTGNANHEIKAVMVVHNETSTGVRNDIPAIRAAIDEAAHPALLLVDAVSSLASMEYHHDDWGVDVTVCGAQKGLMLPPGIAFNAISNKALAASKASAMGRFHFDWKPVISMNEKGYYPYTPPTALFYGLEEALDMLLDEEGLTNVISRHARLAEATRCAVREWCLEIYCVDETAYSDTVTGIQMPDGHSGDAFRRAALDNYNLSLGSGLGPLADKIFRIGHLGDLNELMLMGALCGVEMTLGDAGVPHTKGGVAAALDFLGDG
ncbi:MAG: aminotransferase class V-fold PLP-dependent enzyme [Pseudomonadota bacterium]|nr:aminotransferase class V-fold PLP-dependent enzyme [Pseudomonadota bacterium]